MPARPLAAALAAALLLACGGAGEPAAPATTPAAPPVTVALPALPAPAPAESVAAPPAPARPAAPGDLLTGPFGDRRFGFVLASSHNGRFVVLRRFAGEERPSFGHHGEASQSATQTLFDRVTGDERPIDDVIGVDEARRFVLFVALGTPVVADADTGTFVPLAGADTESDANDCLPPRQAALSEHGSRVGWVTAKGLAVRELATGAQWTVPSQGRLWRGFPDESSHGAVLLELAAGTGDWPRQNTSCACRWCGRFALSYGFYGWSGPAFTVTHVAEDGARSPGEPPEGGGTWHGLTDAGCELVASVPDRELERGPWFWRCSP